MTYPPKIVLHVPVRDLGRLAPFVEECLRDQVELIAVVGDGCEEVHDLIDEMIIGDGSDETRFIVTSWHVGETVEDAIEFAHIFTARGDRVRLVEL